MSSIFNLNQRVKHAKFGLGKVVSFSEENNRVTVRFDKEFEGKIERTFVSNFLEVVEEEIKKPNPVNNSNSKSKEEIKIGDVVIHNEYGEGIVTERKGFFRFVVKFKKNSQSMVVLTNTLTKIENNIIDDDELVDTQISSSFKVVPSNYSEQNSYSTSAKRVLTFLRKKYPDKGIATIKSYKENDGEVGVFIIPNKGVIVFKLFDLELTAEMLLNPMFNAIYSNQYETFKNYYHNNFLQAKSLCKYDDTQKILKYPIRFVFLFQNVDILKLANENKDKIICNNPNFMFKNFSSSISNNDIFSSFECYDNSFVQINEKDYGAIIERVVPENATLIDIVQSKNVIIPKTIDKPSFVPITGKEREFSALCLDDSQIRAINETKPGHYLTLANPGTGKSVLLISKAYRLQSINKNNNILITCYNKNLAEHHTIFAEVSGMKTPRLHISTFHRFIIELIKKADPKFLVQLDVDDDKNFDFIVDRFEELLNLNKIETKLNAIFIDEIQLFEPKWIDLCYRLLDKTQATNSFFEMYGDINQDVKSQKSKGKASWQNTKYVPSLKGRVRKLEKNYRNTELIANYLKHMIDEFNEFLRSKGLIVDSENSCLSSDTSKKGSIKTKILLSANDDFSKVSKLVEELHKKAKAEYSEIAVIYPAKKFGQYYTPIWKIEKDFLEHDIPFSFIHGDAVSGSEKRQKLYECDGVIMSTVDSCLGLDFKYVILCGIHYWDFRYDEKLKKSVKLTPLSILLDESAKHYINEIGKKIYSACSRAREGLFIIDDLDKNSPIKEFIRPKGGKEYFDENK